MNANTITVQQINNVRTPSQLDRLIARASRMELNDNHLGDSARRAVVRKFRAISPHAENDAPRGMDFTSAFVNIIF